MVSSWFNRALYTYRLSRLKKIKQSDTIARIMGLESVINCIKISKEMNNKDIPTSFETYVSDYFILMEYIKEIKKHIDKRKYIVPDKYIGHVNRKYAHQYFKRNSKAILIADAIPTLCEALQELRLTINDARLCNTSLMMYYDRLLPSLLTEIEKVIKTVGDYNGK